MKGLTEYFKLHHHITAAHCPLANGFVEIVFREGIRTNRADLIEMKLGQTHCSEIMECEQSVINHAALVRGRKKKSRFIDPL